jgi:hypothetical protein
MGMLATSPLRKVHPRKSDVNSTLIIKDLIRLILPNELPVAELLTLSSSIKAQSR